MLRVLFALMTLGWIVKKIWENRFSKRTGLPPEFLWRNPTLADIRRKTMALEREIAAIEELVGLDKDPTASVSIWEGLVEWEDFVDPGFEREKEKWFQLNKQLARLTPQPTPPPPATVGRIVLPMPGFQESKRKEEERILAEVANLKRGHPFKYFLVRGGMPGFAGVRHELAVRINPGLRR